MLGSQRPFEKPSYRLGHLSVLSLKNADAGPVAEILTAMDPWRTLAYPLQDLTQYLLRPDPALFRFVVFINSDRAGVVCIRYPWLLGAYLELLAVFPGYQRKGIGEKIMRWLQTETFEVSKNVWSLVSEFNASARSFYEKLGFTEVAAFKDLVRQGYNEILLRLPKAL
jgi:ribosomal protein S18 acetylase RimI-like enzyme